MRRSLELQTFKSDIARIRVFRAGPKTGPWGGGGGGGGGDQEAY